MIFTCNRLCRLERIKLSCLYSKVKILGTLLCVVGAITMSILQSTITIPAAKQLTNSAPPIVLLNKEKIIGCLYLMVAVFILSSNVVLQVNLALKWFIMWWWKWIKPSFVRFRTYVVISNSFLNFPICIFNKFLTLNLSNSSVNFQICI